MKPSRFHRRWLVLAIFLIATACRAEARLTPTTAPPIPTTTPAPTRAAPTETATVTPTRTAPTATARVISTATTPTTRVLPTATTTTPRTVNVQPGDYEQSLTFGGRERRYLLHLPPGIGRAQPLPLVIVLHGGGNTPEMAEKMSGMSSKANSAGFIVAYPQGTTTPNTELYTWNAGNCCGYALDNNVDDVGFIRALIEKLQAEYNVDSQRVFVNGISNGGMMAYRLGCELSDKIAAIAPIAGALNVDCKPSQPVSVVAFHGTNDEHVLYEGGEPITKADPHPRVDNSVAYAMTFWSQRDGCAATPAREERGLIIRDEYAGCANGTGVLLFTIKGSPHIWPLSRGFFMTDPPMQGLSATDAMWEFFKRHPK
jgi:polyhydroxybutyrate depolymerase